MTVAGLLSFLEPLDWLAVGLLIGSWSVVTLVIEHPPARRPSMSILMADYRREWMRHFVTRQPRIFDSSIIANLRQSTSFFTSASMIALGGGFALIGNADMLSSVVSDITPAEAPVAVWEAKVTLMLVFAANAFLKFVWSHRLFGYCSVLMAAVPNEPDDPVAYPRASQAAEINITAARGYNRGLRSVYFGIAASAWLLGAVPLLVATALTVAVILRREFASLSRSVLLDDPAHLRDTQR